MRRSLFIVTVVVTACVSTGRGRVVDESRGAITGVVMDATGQPIRGAQVRALPLAGQNGGRAVAMTSPESGMFLLRLLPDGAYELQVRAICCSMYRRRHQIVSQRLDTVRVTLAPGARIPE